MAASVWTTTPARALDVLSDERLARLAARGDQRASNALFARHQPGLTRYCRTILRNGADAEDATQNALVAAHRALEAGTVPMRVKPWLYRIAHNEAISLARLRRPAEELDEARLPPVADAAEAGEIRRRLGQLMSDLRALTDRQREALVLRELCGLDYAEIAQTLGTSEGAAQQTVFEARSALQQFGEGRALDCEHVQRAMSDCDGMRLRTRRVRAHVRGCPRCREFETALRARRRDLGMLFPPTGAAGGVIAALARLLGEPLVAGLGIKGAAVGLAVLAGGGAVVATSVGGGERPNRPAAVTAAPAASTGGGAAAAPAAPAQDAATVSPSARTRDGDRRPERDRRPARRPAAAAGPADPEAAVVSDGDAVASAPAGAGGGAEPRGSSGGGGSVPGSGPGSGSGGGSSGTTTQPADVIRRPIQDVAGVVGQVVADTTDAVDQVVPGTTDAVGDTVEETAGTVDGAAGDATDTVTGVGGGVTDAVGGLLGAP